MRGIGLIQIPKQRKHAKGEPRSAQLGTAPDRCERGPKVRSWEPLQIDAKGDQKVRSGSGFIIITRTGTGQVDLGAAQVDLGSFQVDPGTAQMDLGAAQVDLGDAQMDLGCAQVSSELSLPPRRA